MKLVGVVTVKTTTGEFLSEQIVDFGDPSTWQVEQFPLKPPVPTGRTFMTISVPAPPLPPAGPGVPGRIEIQLLAQHWEVS